MKLSMKVQLSPNPHVSWKPSGASLAHVPTVAIPAGRVSLDGHELVPDSVLGTPVFVTAILPDHVSAAEFTEAVLGLRDGYQHLGLEVLPVGGGVQGKRLYLILSAERLAPPTGASQAFWKLVVGSKSFATMGVVLNSADGRAADLHPDYAALSRLTHRLGRPASRMLLEHSGGSPQTPSLEGEVRTKNAPSGDLPYIVRQA